ncbi:MAG: CidA/LrgA family protein [Oscillospiraceae bacterium]|nr:CidA/LrgA family protein [Oscillospiraceae bacterium]
MSLKHLSQIAWIAAVSFGGELLNYLLPLPIPGSIYGLVLMLILLMTGIVKLDRVKSVGDWLVSIMPVMFVGPVVGLISSYGSYKDIIIPVFVITALTTVITMVVTGFTAQGIIRLQEGKEDETNAE